MTPLARSIQIVTQKLENETLVYDLDSHKACCLNETSAEVWRLCDGSKTLSEIQTHLGNRLKLPVSKDLIILALNQLEENNLLENGNRLPSSLSGVSRRALIRKVGFASVVALPLISSVVSPISANAQSLLAFLEACTAPAECQSGNCSGDAVSTPKCCVPGSIASCPPTDLVIGLECVPDAGTCNFAAQYCCSNSTTFGPQGICAPGLQECRCD